MTTCANCSTTSLACSTTRQVRWCSYGYPLHNSVLAAWRCYTCVVWWWE